MPKKPINVGVIAAELKHQTNGFNGAMPPISTVLPESFRLRTDEKDAARNGVFFVEGKDEIRICSILKILAVTRNQNGEAWGRLLELTDADGTKKTWALPMSLFAGDGNEFRAQLLSLGLEIAPTRRAKELLARYIQETKPARRVRCVQTVGWHAGFFVLPDETFGATSDGENLIFQTEFLPEHRFKVSGDIDSWRAQIARFCVGNSRLAFAVSCAFAAVLLPVVDEPGGGFHFRGASSLGKSTALLVAGSVCGGGGQDGFLESWRTTTNGLEAVAEMHNHVLLCLDEIKQCDSRLVGDTAYLLGNGQGKSRMTRGGQMKRRPTWNLLFLSNGETSLASLIEENGGRVYGGQEVRMCEIEADSGRFGLFENLHGFADGDALATHLRAMSKRIYGAPLREFLHKITQVDHAEIRAKWQIFHTEFLSDCLPENAGGEVIRVARRFALAAFAGEAAEFVTGWKAGEARRAAIHLFDVWLGNRGNVGASDAEALISQVRLFIETHGASRFEKIDGETARTINNRVGFRRDSADGDGFEYLILPESFRREVCKGFNAKDAATALAAGGFLEKDKAGKSTQPVYVPALKRTTRLYVIKSGISGDESSKAEAGESFAASHFLV